MSSYHRTKKHTSVKFELTEVQWESVFNGRRCFYCGEAANIPNRIIMDKGWVIENLQPACSSCALMRRDMNHTEFLLKIRKIARNSGFLY